ncbi:hypothetical protein CSV75_12485 [Sporosarcina sp. P18a]|uniref:DNA (cytosine-5-)-methyltransferase n=1 Tax=Sporosarcina sp. P18a TaxID=2048259 RepID=UPI000C16F4D4|nr:DNA (cytosine-5-)-methyltransferase [Sporosarcina sp. P18a]PIC79403.1 hypothetical protein CSV75_12485 [Sporosarcina sp. P18a]
MENIGTQIRKSRKKINLSQAKLAKEAGIVQSLLSQWELGKRLPSDDEYNLLMKTIEDLEDSVKNGKIRLNEKKFINTVYKRNNKAVIKTPEEYYEQLKNIKHDYSHEENEKYVKTLGELNKSRRFKSNEEAAKLNAIALFSGCGGFSLGFKAAGVNILGHVEINPAARAVYSANFPDSICLGTDITELKSDDIVDWKERFGHINILYGGPPCQGFSLAGKRDPEDERNILFENYLEIAKIIQPDVLVFENVRVMTSLKTKSGELFIDQLLLQLEEIGYSSEVAELNAKDFGVAQSRERVILIAVNKKLGVSSPGMPHKTNGREEEKNLFTAQLEKHVSFRDAVGDLKGIEMGEIDRDDPLHWSITHPDHVVEWLKVTPEGKSAHENEDITKRPKSGYNTTYKRIFWDEPCSTIGTNFSMISGSRNVHPEKTRSFTVREAARCQSFPDDFAFFGSWGEIRSMIGNAVPPLLAYKLADYIVVNILKEKVKKVGG